MVVEGKKKVTK